MTRRELLPLMGLGLAGGAVLTSQSCIASTEKSLYKAAPRFSPPPKLIKGDTIGICAPAGALRRKEEVSEFTSILQEMGFNVKVGKNVYEKYGYLAGTDEQRASDFMDLINDQEVKGIFFLRGGWGCARLFELLDYSALRENPKVIMGFSDATSLLNHLTSELGLITFHGPSGNSTWNKYSKGYIKGVLLDGDSVKFKNESTDHEITTYQGGEATGFLFGGNLSVLCSMIGIIEPNFVRGSILFLEDVGEEPYRIDRMLTQLKQANIISNCNGIILGNFRKCTAEEPDRSFSLEEVFDQHFGDIDIPVYYGAQIGHAVNKFTVPIGATATMNADKGTFELLRPAVQ